MPDLWPDEFGHETLIPPIVILREQAKALALKTKGLVIAVIGSGTWNGELRHTFYLEVPTLEDYRYELFQASHGVLLYPVEISTTENRATKLLAENPEMLTAYLRQIFNMQSTIKVLRALLSQASVTSDTGEA